jgi:hypothetical protein
MQHKVSYFQSFLPESYKQEVQPQAINPNYYMTETSPIHQSSTSNVPPQPPNSYTEQFMETQLGMASIDELNQLEMGGMDELNNTIVDMNNMDSVI